MSNSISHKPIVVLGLGNWGTALANHLALLGHTVVGWSAQQEIVDSINTEHRNVRYQSTFQLSTSVSATTDPACCKNAEIVVLTIPSSALDSAVPKFAFKENVLIVSGIKGLEHKSLFTPLQFLRQSLGDAAKLVVLSGPSFASDVLSKRPVSIVAASDHEPHARQVAELFSNETMRVYISTDPLGVELGGVLKNVVAVAAGVCDGLSLGDSARAAVITRGLAEMVRLATALGAQRETLFGLSGLGDLAMTAASATSRNRTVGFRLGQGEKLDAILKTLGSVAEGVTATPLVLSLASKHQCELPITQAVADLLAGNLTPAAMVKRLILRPLKREF